MRKGLLFIIVATVLTGMTISVEAFEIGVRGYYWWPELNGDLKVDGNGVRGTRLDLESDLGMSDESYPVIEAFAGLGKHHLSISYYNVDYDGSKTLSESMNFKGQTFTANTFITSSLEYDVYDFMYQYDLLDLENFLVGGSLGLVGKVKLFDGSVRIRSTDLSASEDFTVPIPMLGLNFHAGILLNILEARLLVAGIGYGDGTIFEGHADISYTPFPFVDIHGGYRVFSVDVDADDVEFNYDTSGPYLAVTIGF